MGAVCQARVPGMDEGFREVSRGPVVPGWVAEMTAAILALALLAVMVYFFRPRDGRGPRADFTIVVEGSEVMFRGDFPAASEQAVMDFLLNDCGIEGAYRISGRWEEGRLAVDVEGEHAKELE